MVRNDLEVDPNKLRWNGSVTGPRTLQRFLSEAGQMTPAPNLVVVFDPRTPCDVVQAVRRMVDNNLRCGGPSLACVEYADAEWRKAMPIPP